MNLPEIGVRPVVFVVQYLQGCYDEEGDKRCTMRSEGRTGNCNNQEFADDVALLADTWLVLVGIVMRMEVLTQRFEGKNCAKNSKVTQDGRRLGNVTVEELNLKGETIRQVEEFTYMGTGVLTMGIDEAETALLILHDKG